MAGEVSFFSVGVGDVARARTFYGELLRWTFEQVSGGLVISGGGVPGGIHGGDEARARTSSSGSTTSTRRSRGWRSSGAGPSRPSTRSTATRSRRHASGASRSAATTRARPSGCTSRAG